MTLARAFGLGLLAALVLVLAVVAGGRLDGAALLALASLPPLTLAGAAVFTPVRGWPRRLLRGAAGFVLAGLAGLAAYLSLRGRTDWFHWPDERGGDVFVLLLCALAAVPGGIAAAPARHGLALAGGLVLGLGAALVLAGAGDPGLLLLLGLGALVGAGLGALDRALTRP